MRGTLTPPPKTHTGQNKRYGRFETPRAGPGEANDQIRFTCELRRSNSSRGENARSKRIMADLALDKQILQEVARRKI